MFATTMEISDGVKTALSTAFSDVSADVTSIVTTALPYALGVVGLGLAITLGIKYFKRIAK